MALSSTPRIGSGPNKPQALIVGLALTACQTRETVESEVKDAEVISKAGKVRAVIDLALRKDCEFKQEPSKESDLKIAFEYKGDQYTLEHSGPKGDDPENLLLSHQEDPNKPQVHVMIDSKVDGTVDIGAVMNATSEEEKRFYASPGGNVAAMIPENGPYWVAKYDNTIDAAHAYLTEKCSKK